MLSKYEKDAEDMNFESEYLIVISAEKKKLTKE